MEKPFKILLFMIYLILGLLYFYHYIQIKLKSRKKTDKNKYLAYTDQPNGIAFSTIRNQYFSIEEYSMGRFFINAYMEEAFNIFLKLSPSMISTLTKADRRIINLKEMIDNQLLSEIDLKKEIDNIDALLDAFIQVSHQMIEKLEEATSITYDSLSPIQIPIEAAKAYMSAVNVLTDLTDNHSIINYETHCLLLKKYPNLVEPFRIIASKITYLFFINLISYSNRIDENLIVFNTNK